MIPTGVAWLQLGSFNFLPPFVRYELTGLRQNLLQSGAGAVCASGDNLDSEELTYQVFISGCGMAGLEDTQAALQDQLNLAPHVFFYRRATPDANLYINGVRSGKLEPVAGDLRARFSDPPALSLTLTVTITPGPANATFPSGLAAFAKGLIDWESADIRALLITTSSTIPQELYLSALSDAVDLAEFAGAGYGRIAVAGALVEDGGGSFVELLVDDPDFGDLGDDTEQIAGMVLYLHVGADTVNVPLFLIQVDPFDPGGSDVTIPTDLSGLF